MRRRRGLAGLAIVLVAAVLGPPGVHLIRATLADRHDRAGPAAGSVDDASGLDENHVAQVWHIPEDTVAAEQQLVALVQRARTRGIPISIAGARHSMGGHSIRRDGIVISMLPFHAMQLDPTTNILRVQAGALWSAVLPYLNASGRSVAIMQSNNSFSVGGSISVNCHGWQANRPPIASSVESFRILRADATIVRCSRTENAELFSLALGGYGLFGVILDVDLRVVPNEEYRCERMVLPAREYAVAFQRSVAGNADVGMAFGRLSVAPGNFLDTAILNVFHSVPSGRGKPSAVEFPEIRGLTRAVFRGQVNSDYGKRLRWHAEKWIGDALAGGPVYRNQLLSEPVSAFENRSAASTDILHEYFVPPVGFEGFVAQARNIVPRYSVDLLNVTLRDLKADDDTFLRYADQQMLALVMLFNVPRTAEADRSAEAMTRELIDAARRHGGRFYLPYRLHATNAQLEAAYPQIGRFFELKRRYDPQELFQNSFYLRYAGVEDPRPKSSLQR